jgi:zinc protease
VFDKLVDKVKTEGFKTDEVADMKVTYLTGFYYKNETNQAQASNQRVPQVHWQHCLGLPGRSG